MSPGSSDPPVLAATGWPASTTARRSAGLPQPHRQVPHRGMRTPRADRPRRPGAPTMSQLPDHRSNRPDDLRRLRRVAHGRPPHPRRADLPELPSSAHTALLDLRPHRTLHGVEAHRPAPCGGCDKRRGQCSVCGRMRVIHSGTADASVCGPRTTPDAVLRRPCPTCGQAERLHALGSCPRCTLKQRLHELLADDSGSDNPKLRSLRDAPADTERTGTAMRRLSRGMVFTVLPPPAMRSTGGDGHADPDGRKPRSGATKGNGVRRRGAVGRGWRAGCGSRRIRRVRRCLPTWPGQVVSRAADVGVATSCTESSAGLACADGRP